MSTQLPTIYPVRTPPLYWLVFLAICALCWTITIVLTPRALFLHPSTRLSDVTIAALGLITAITPVLYWFGSRAYRIPGGSGELRLFPDRIELQSRGRSTPIVLPVSDLVVRLTSIRVRYTAFHVIPLASAERARSVTFKSGGAVLEIVDHCLPDRRQLDGLLEDIDALRDGRPARGPRIERSEERSPSSPPSPDHYDEMLERELDD